MAVHESEPVSPAADPTGPHGPVALSTTRGRNLVPWAMLGAIGAVWRLMALEPPRTSEAVTLVVVALVWAIVLRLLATRPISAGSRVVLVGAAGLLLLAVAGLWVGRDSLLVALGGVLVVDASWPLQRPSLPWQRSRRFVAPLAVIALVVAQLQWVRLLPLPTVLALTAVAYLLALLPDPRVPERWRSAVASGSSSLISVLRSAWGRRGVRVWVGIGALALGVAALWSPVIEHLVTDPEFRVLGINDYPLHVEVGGRFSLFPYVNNAPHFLFHAATATWHLVFSLETAAVLAICSAITLSFVAVVVLMRQPTRVPPRLPLGMAVVVALWFFLAESPGLFAIWWGWVPSTSPIYTLHWWANPTWLTAMPFVVLTLPLVEAAIDAASARRRTAWPLVALGVVTVLGAVAKPALAIPLVPALPLYLVVVRRLPWDVVRTVLLWCAVPAGLIVFWQTWFLDSSDASQFSSGFTVEFIVDAPFGWSNVGWVFLFPFVLIVLAMALAGRDFFRDRSAQLVLTCLVFALPLMLFVNETGERSVHGNFAVPAQGCMTLLVLVSVRITACQLLDAWRTRSERRSAVVVVVVAAVALAFLAGGILSWLDGVGGASVPVDWLDNIRG